MKVRILLMVGSSLFALVDCRASHEGSSVHGSSSAFAAPTVPPAGSCGAQQALERLDTRIAVPLLPMMASHQKQNMRDHLLAVREVVAGLATEDFAAVEQAAARLGYSEQMGRMCTHMGAGAPGFGERALAFHHTADTIVDGARARDREKVMAALSATLGACTDCHAAYRQSVVDEGTWNRVTSLQTPPSAALHH